mmetsp:Transcript_2856/g.7490  ORF Transcript_2856/g.7490 Transcript_2856/m.7490 type:complete len:213 (-) Transcript_2856:421-1059(-)
MESKGCRCCCFLSFGCPWFSEQVLAAEVLAAAAAPTESPPGPERTLGVIRGIDLVHQVVHGGVAFRHGREVGQEQRVVVVREEALLDAVGAHGKPPDEAAHLPQQRVVHGQAPVPHLLHRVENHRDAVPQHLDGAAHARHVRRDLLGRARLPPGGHQARHLRHRDPLRLQRVHRVLALHENLRGHPFDHVQRRLIQLYRQVFVGAGDRRVEQ